MGLRNRGTNIQVKIVPWAPETEDYVSSIYVGIPPKLKTTHLSPMLFFLQKCMLSKLTKPTT